MYDMDMRQPCNTVRVRYGLTFQGTLPVNISAERPVIVLGYGIRSSGADPSILQGLQVPILSSWQAADLFDNESYYYFGRPGVYGQRCANEILYAADVILAIGN